jgi:hypothetical protein
MSYTLFLRISRNRRIFSRISGEPFFGLEPRPLITPDDIPGTSTIGAVTPLTLGILTSPSVIPAPAISSVMLFTVEGNAFAPLIA